jgi:hypothetical protein
LAPQLIDDFPSDSVTTLAALAASPAGAWQLDRLACDFRAAATTHGLASPPARPALAPSLPSPTPSVNLNATPSWQQGAAAYQQCRVQVPCSKAVGVGRAATAPQAAVARAAKVALAVVKGSGRSKRCAGTRPPRATAAAVSGGAAANRTSGAQVQLAWMPTPLAEPLVDVASTANIALPHAADAAVILARQVVPGGGAGAAVRESPDAPMPAPGRLWELTRLLPPL